MYPPPPQTFLSSSHARSLARHGNLGMNDGAPSAAISSLLNDDKQKVTAPSEGKVGLEFLLDRHNTGTSENDGSTASTGGDASQSVEDKSGTGRQRLAVDEGGGAAAPVSDPGNNMAAVAAATFAGADEGGYVNCCIVGGVGDERTTARGEKEVAAGLPLRSEAPGATVLLRARRKVPVLGASGQPIVGGSAAATGTATATATASPTASPTSKGGPRRATKENGGPTLPSGQNKNKTVTSRQRESSGNLEATEATRGETRDMVIQVYWDGTAKDRAYIEAYPAKKGDRGEGGAGGEGDQCPLLLRLGVRVPTLAIVDAQAASKFAERVVEQVSIQMGDQRVSARGTRGGGQRQQYGQTLRLAGVDEKSVVAIN